VFGVLTPAPARQARLQVRTLEGYEARPRSLALEWWSLFRARPIANGALIAVAALILVFTTPLGALAELLGRTPLRGSLAAARSPVTSVAQGRLDRDWARGFAAARWTEAPRGRRARPPEPERR
jgi:hypothetical protein